MRADRLIAVLMLLQRHGRVTAKQVAQELEISERTARRDLEALGMAGIPVFSSPGRGGGWELVGGARTDLSGLSAPEVRALFLAAGSIPGQPVEVTNAMRKLMRAVPEPFREQAAAAAEAVFVDRTGWWQAVERDSPPLLDVVHDALVRGRQVVVTYRDRVGAETRRRVHPLGAVSKGGWWYLVADTERGRRSFRVDRISALDVTDERAARPANFDLQEAWRDITAGLAAQRPRHRVSAVVEPWVIAIVRRLFRDQVASVGAADLDGRHRIEIEASSVHSAVALLAGFGAAVQVLDPPEALEMLSRIGTELVERYGAAPSVPPSHAPAPVVLGKL